MRTLLALSLLLAIRAPAVAGPGPSPGDQGWPAGWRTLTPAQAAAEAQKAHGQVVLFVYWAAWCGDCRQELPALEALAKELGPRGLRLLAYDMDEDPAPLVRLLAARGLALDKVRLAPVDKPAMIAASKSLGGLWKGGIPYLLILGRDGKVRAEWTAGKPVSSAELAAAIHAAL